MSQPPPASVSITMLVSDDRAAAGASLRPAEEGGAASGETEGAMSPPPPPPPPSLLRSLSSQGVAAGAQAATAGAGLFSSASAARAVVPTFYCQICMSRFPVDEATLLGCGHRFCSPCFSAYVKSKVNEGCVYLRCIFDRSLTDEGDAASADRDDAAEDAGAADEAPGPIGNHWFPMPGPRAAAAAIALDRDRNGGLGAGTAAAGALPAPAPMPARRLVDRTCKATIRELDVLGALAGCEPELERYRRFKAATDDPNVRECPYAGCAALVAGGSPTAPAMRCSNCSREFCFLHSNAHVGRSCEAYDLEHLQETRLNEAALNADSKPCPKCGIRTNKMSGCNHITCGKCKANWCWICSQEIGGGVAPDHYAWYRIGGCGSLQFAAAPGNPACRLLRQLLGLLVIAALFFPALALALLSLVVCPCCSWRILQAGGDNGRVVVWRNFTMLVLLWLNLLYSLLLFTLLLPLLLLAALLFCLCFPCCVSAIAQRQAAETAAQLRVLAARGGNAGGGEGDEGGAGAGAAGEGGGAGAAVTAPQLPHPPRGSPRSVATAPAPTLSAAASPSSPSPSLSSARAFRASLALDGGGGGGAQRERDLEAASPEEGRSGGGGVGALPSALPPKNSAKTVRVG